MQVQGIEGDDGYKDVEKSTDVKTLAHTKGMSQKRV